MTRVELLKENAILVRLTAANTEMEALRRVEQSFGSDSVRTSRIFSEDSYDIQVNSVGFNNRVVEVTFTPDEASDSLGGVLEFDYTMTTSGESAVLVYVEPLLPSDNTTKFRLYLSGSDYFTVSWVRLKFFFFANASGTFSAVSI